MKTRLAQVFKIFGIMAMVAAFAAAAFPTRSFAAASDPLVGKLIVNVYERSDSQLTEQPLTGASIRVFDAKGAAVATAATNTNGSVTIELPKGVYKVSVSAPGYTTASGAATVNVGQATTIKFQLSPNKQ